jgi:hypothetical protein
MANSFLSPTIITREALRILHANLNFIGNINRQYDDRFANSGASPSGKIGPTLTIRNPNRFTVRTGVNLATADIVESSQQLTVSTIKGVDWVMTQSDLTLTIDDYSNRYLKPAMARLASDIEADALSMYKDVYNLIPAAGASAVAADVLGVGRRLFENLAPENDLVGTLSARHNVDLVTDLKGLFNPQADIGQNLRKGMVAKQTLGFDIYRNSLVTPHQTGTALAATTYTVNGAGQTGAGVIVATGATTFKKGDVINFAGANAVHPETKADLGYLQNFSLTADYAGGAGTVAISPAIVATGASQNVTASPTNGGAVAKLGGGASALLNQSLFFHPDAFTFVTADLIDPSSFGARGARQVQDGISMSMAQQYSISDMTIKSRMDVLYGFKTIRPELAARLTS